MARASLTVLPRRPVAVVVSPNVGPWCEVIAASLRQKRHPESGELTIKAPDADNLIRSLDYFASVLKGRQP
jgi:hypothetical protein